MNQNELSQTLQQGIAEAEKGNLTIALIQLDNAARLGNTALLSSYLGYCIAMERREFKKGAALCNEALRQEPNQPLHYLNLGRVYLGSGQKGLAIKALRKGLRFGNDRRITKLLTDLGIRKKPVFSSLDREHFLNKFFGKMLHRFGMR